MGCSSSVVRTEGTGQGLRRPGDAVPIEGGNQDSTVGEEGISLINLKEVQHVIIPADEGEYTTGVQLSRDTEGVDGEERQVEQYVIEAAIPQVYQEHVIGLDNEKMEIKDFLDTFVFNFDDFAGVGMTPPKGILLHGPSGCGKALLAEAFACKYAFNFISVTIPQLNPLFVDCLIKKIDESAPCILLLRHLDCVVDAGNRKEIAKSLDKVVREIIDSKRVIVFATARNVKNVDSALLRPGRLEKTIYIPKPDREGRVTRWRALFYPTNSLFYKSDVDYDEIADLTRGFSHRDLASICEQTFKDCGVTMDITTQKQIVTIRKENLQNSINNHENMTREDSMLYVPD